MDKSGWWVAAILLVLLIFRDRARAWAKKAIGAAQRAVWRGRALSRYRAGLTRRYAYVHIPFVDTEVLMHSVYMPPAQPPPADALRLVVTGAPGSGKSWLLRHELLTRGDRVGVLCELHRHDGTDLTIEAHVAQQVQLSGFPQAQRFIERALRSGRLAVLLDGFDEVSTSERPRVAEMIKDFGGRHPRARIVVTCRTEAYDNQLAPELTQRYAVGEFDDRLIRRFLMFWPGMDHQRTEQLLEALRDPPRILRLARNPLLLSMIAGLYLRGDEDYRLPRSRTELYQQATDYLLRRKETTANGFDAPTERAVLQRLALAHMDAPRLNELTDPAEDAGPTLAKIVGRSRLLLVFLATCELKESSGSLLERYRKDPEYWRECAKLWCGVTDEDCTEVVRTVYELDPVLGLESLADARKLDAALADRIIEEMVGRLEDSGVADAFGAVASDPGPRGITVYKRLLRLAKDGTPGAVAALAATNSAKACQTVAKLAAQDRDAREALMRMGDLAVPALAPIEEDWAVDGLARTATPAAIEALMLALWRANATRAAWHLASLMRDPEVHAIMRDTVPPFRWTSDRAWYWEPFLSLEDGLHDVVGRIGDLLNTVGAEEAIPEGLGPLDPRLGVPLWIEVDKPPPPAEVGENPDAMKQLLPDCAATRLLDRLDGDIAYQLRCNWFAGTPGSKQDWLGVRWSGADRFSFDRSRQHRVVYGAVMAVLGVASLFALAALFDLSTAWGPAWLAVITIVLNFISWYPLIVDRAHDNFTILARYSLGWIRVGYAIAERTADPQLWKSAVTGTATALSFFVVLLNLQLHLGWPAAIVILAAVCAGVAAAVRQGMQRQDHASNPLGHLIRRIDELTTLPAGHPLRTVRSESFTPARVSTNVTRGPGDNGT